MTQHNEIIRSPKGDDESKLSKTQTDFFEEAIELQVQRIREHYLRDFRRSRKVLGQMLVTLKSAMEQAAQRKVSDEEIARRLDLDLTGQSIGQYRNTVMKFGELMDDSIPFEVWNIARQQDKKDRTAAALAEIVTEHPTVAEIREVMKSKVQKPGKTIKFSVTSRIEDIDGARTFVPSVVRYDAKAAAQSDVDQKTYFSLAVAAARTAIEEAIGLANSIAEVLANNATHQMRRERGDEAWRKEDEKFHAEKEREYLAALLIKTRETLRAGVERNKREFDIVLGWNEADDGKVKVDDEQKNQQPQSKHSPAKHSQQLTLYVRG